MKKIVLLLGTLALGMGGCKSFLDEKPYDFLTPANFYQNEADAVAALNGVFSTLQAQAYYQRTTWLISELPGDAMGTTATSGERFELFNNTFTTTNSEVANWWVNSYRLINRANDVIGKVPAVNMDQTRKNAILGNARFLRGMAFFDLVRGYGAIPLPLTATSGPDSDVRPARAPLADVYKQIIEDLKFAEANCLPENKITGSEKGRASSGAAATLLGKAYLTRASTKAAEPTDNQDALAAFNRVIGSGLYSLISYADVFNPDKENGPEHIFSVQFDLPPNTGNITPRMHLPTQLAGFGAFTVPNWLVTSYATTDVRRAWNLSNATNASGTNTQQQYYYVKFRDPLRILNDSRCNWLVTRYADVLLLQSEALNNLNAGDATKYNGINAVRRRAGLANLPTTATTKDDFVDLLLQERAQELCAEGHRWYDLLRTGRQKQRQQTVYNRTVTDQYLLLPIPQSEILLNPNLVQNPGYN
jgi:hypothetical protein